MSERASQVGVFPLLGTRRRWLVRVVRCFACQRSANYGVTCQGSRECSSGVKLAVPVAVLKVSGPAGGEGEGGEGVENTRGKFRSIGGECFLQAMVPPWSLHLPGHCHARLDCSRCRSPLPSAERCVPSLLPSILGSVALDARHEAILPRWLSAPASTVNAGFEDMPLFPTCGRPYQGRSDLTLSLPSRQVRQHLSQRLLLTCTGH